MVDAAIAIAAPQGAAGTSPEAVPSSGRSLAEVLVRRPECTEVAGDATRVVFRERRYLLTPLAVCEGRGIVLAEWPGHAEVPDWHARQRLQARAAQLHPDPVILCTDAAGTREVWGWRRRVGSLPPTYVEEHRQGDRGGARALPWLEGVERPFLDESSQLRAGAAAGATALLGRLRRSRVLLSRIRKRTGEDSLGTLVRLIEESSSPMVAREIWRSLVRLRVLDPACGGGEWLLGCLEALVAVALACLERMQGWVAADDGEPPVRPSASHPDFRRLLRRRGELAAAGGRERLAYETVLLYCLHGVAEGASDTREARRRLAERVPRLSADAEPLLGEALVDVRVGSILEAGELRHGRATPWHRDPRLTAIAREVEERATALGRANAQLVRLRLELGGCIDELADGRREIRKRNRQLRGSLAAALGQPKADVQLHASLEYSEVARGDGFDLLGSFDPGE